MNEALRLAGRDLRGGIGGLGLLLLCLAIAVAGIAAVTSLSSAIGSSIADNGRSLLGGDLMLSVAQRDATSEEKAAIDAARAIVADRLIAGDGRRPRRADGSRRA